MKIKEITVGVELKGSKNYNSFSHSLSATAEVAENEDWTTMEGLLRSQLTQICKHEVAKLLNGKNGSAE